MVATLPTEAFCEVELEADATYDRADFEAFVGRGGAIQTHGHVITLVGAGRPARKSFRRGDTARRWRDRRVR